MQLCLQQANSANKAMLFAADLARGACRQCAFLGWGMLGQSIERVSLIGQWFEFETITALVEEKVVRQA